MEEQPKKNGKSKLVVIIIVAIFACILVVAIAQLGGDGTVTPTATPRPRATAVPEVVMYFCGIDRCRDSGTFGELLFESGINVWENPEPNRGKVAWKATNGQRVVVMETKRVGEGAGGMWYRLKQGGWTNGIWLTEEPCTKDNWQRYAVAC